jgi:hypothetical protein
MPPCCHRHNDNYKNQPLYVHRYHNIRDESAVPIHRPLNVQAEAQSKNHRPNLKTQNRGEKMSYLRNNPKLEMQELYRAQSQVELGTSHIRRPRNKLVDAPGK